MLLLEISIPNRVDAENTDLLVVSYQKPHGRLIVEFRLGFTGMSHKTRRRCFQPLKTGHLFRSQTTSSTVVFFFFVVFLEYQKCCLNSKRAIVAALRLKKSTLDYYSFAGTMQIEAIDSD